MPISDRHRTRIVPIEFDFHESFSQLQLAERVCMILIKSGKVSLLLNKKAVTLMAPSALLISQYDEIQLMEETRIEAQSFCFNPIFMNSTLTFENLKANQFSELEDEHDRNMMNLFLSRDTDYDGTMELPATTYLRLSEWFSVIGTEVNTQSDGYWTCRIRRYLLQTLYLLDDIYMEHKKPQSIKRDKSFVDVLLEHIHVNYPGDISLNQLCELVHINRTTLNHKFKLQTGHTVMEYLLSYRLKIACEALSHTNLSLAEIADAVGFRYDTYFIKQFTKRNGVTPTEYRKCEDKRLPVSNNAVMKERKGYISDEQVVKRANAAVKIELEKKKAMDIPIVVYDRKTQTLYQVNSDGSKTELGKRIRKGRYSERISKKT